jgi:hypothetical protein
VQFEKQWEMVPAKEFVVWFDLYGGKNFPYQNSWPTDRCEWWWSNERVACPKIARTTRKLCHRYLWRWWWWWSNCLAHGKEDWCDWSIREGTDFGKPKSQIPDLSVRLELSIRTVHKTVLNATDHFKPRSLFRPFRKIAKSWCYLRPAYLSVLPSAWN